MKRILSFCLAGTLPLSAADEAATLLRSWRFTDERLDLTAAGAEIMLPAGAAWRLETAESEAPVKQLMLHPGGLNRSRGTGSPQQVRVSGLAAKSTKPFTLRFVSDADGRTCSVAWDPAAGETKDDLLREWAEARATRYGSMEAPRGSLTDRWARESPAIFGGRPAGREFDRFNADGGDPMDTLAVFGGRCAVAETLQLRDIDQGPGGPISAKKFTDAVNVSELPGVDVKSHPFAELAARHDARTAPLELASLCPPDRFFAFFPQPRRIRTIIEQLGSASDHLSAPATDGATDYRLWQKYLDRMGLREETVRTWMDGGHAESVAFTLPDLFIRDGTDITLLIRMKDGNAPLLFSAMPETAAVLTLPGSGGKCHLARRGQVLLASTSRTELELSLALADRRGAGSLGASDELRCMRQRLPDSPATAAWFYFSDGFIRRLTGPEVKIGQHRRLAARERLESLTAAALLHRMDHGTDAPDSAALIRSGYAAGFKPAATRWEPAVRLNPQESASHFAGISLTAGTARSETWGTLADLLPLSARPVTTATAEEATMYASYAARYQDYWRRYFDPIAIRLDESAPGTWSLSTLVLPLVDNSLYTGLKQALDTTKAAAMPALDPPPFAGVALAVHQDVLHHRSFMALTPGLPDIAGALTGRLAVALPDADPVFQSGGITGLQQMGSLIGGRNELAAIGLAVSIFTRPVDLFLETTDESRALALLDALILSSRSSFLTIRRITRESENRRLYVVDLDSFAQIHFAASVEHGWLHLSNHPWSGTMRVTGTEPAARGSAFIRVNPDALKAGQAAAVFQAQNQRRRRLLTAAAELVPWMEALGLDSDHARERQFAALGLCTPLPAGTAITSLTPLTIPGVLNKSGETLSAADTASDPGILNGIRSVELFTSLEEDGLRATLEWRVAP